MQIGIINYQGGNVGSVLRAFEYVSINNKNAKVYLANNKNEINKADRLVIPGQGSMPQTMKTLRENGLADAICDNWGKKPTLGICVGMQILFDESQESDENVNTKGLGLIKGSVINFSNAFKETSNLENLTKLKIPHMGWSSVKVNNHPLWVGISKNNDNKANFYFAHSYYCSPDNKNLSAGTTTYGIQYPSAITMPAFFAVQFHPEKSGETGLKLLQNFLTYDF